VPLFKSVLHNIAVVIGGLGFAFIGTRLDFTFGDTRFQVSVYTGCGFSAFDRRISDEASFEKRVGDVAPSERLGASAWS